MIKRYCDICKEEENLTQDRRILPVSEVVKRMKDECAQDHISMYLVRELEANYGEICNMCLDKIRDNLDTYGRNIAKSMIPASVDSREG